VRGDLPSGTVTFVFTDIEGSTRLLHELGDAYVGVLAEHRRILRESAAAHGGVEVDTQGDAFFFAFARARDAVEAARVAQDGLSASPTRVRMGIHTGQPILTDEGYVGLDVHRGARIAAAGHGAQVLLSEATRQLVDAVVRDLGLHRLKDLQAPERIYQLGDTEFPPLKTLNQTNLPVQPTPFLGRERELTDVLELLRRDDVRLLTLTGPGGSGKTRLGLQAAAELVEEYPDGVWFVGLAALTDPALVLPTIAQTLGIREGGSASYAEALAEHLRTKRALLVLDNLEQLLPDAASPLGELSAAAPKVDLITSSRERLHLSGEHEYPVPPLSLDEATSLFAERARAIRPEFVVDGSRSEVEAICTRLDHLPLAIELAAARVRILSVEQLLARLDQRLPLLTSGAADAPERQRTLRAAIEWSCDLLNAGERALFARLAVFSGGGTLDAAERICAADLDTLGSLVDKSLVRAVAGPDEEPRFAMLETIRELALERLGEGSDADEVRGRHATYFLDLATSAEEGMRGPDQARWLSLLDAELDNFRAAMWWALDGSDPELGLRIGVALSLLWYFRGPMSEGRWWLELALERASPLPSDARARALSWTAYFAMEQGEEATALFEASVRCAREAGAVATEALATTYLSVTFPPGVRSSEMVSLGLRAVDLARTSDDRWVLAVALNNLGVVCQEAGNDLAAKAAFEESYALGREIGDSARMALPLANLAEMAIAVSDLARADELSQEALQLAKALGDRKHTAAALAIQGWVALARRSLGEAAGRFVQSLELLRNLGHAQTSVPILFGLAGISAALGDVSRAARLEAAAIQFETILGHTPSAADFGIYQPYLDELRAATQPSVWEAAASAVADMKLNEVIALALSSR
jgi:predicted ATPase